MSAIPSYSLPSQSLALNLSIWGEPQHYNGYEPHRHNYHEILIFQSGQAVHEIDFREYPVSAPAVHLVKAGQVHTVRRSPGSKGLSMLFSGLALEETEAFSTLPLLTLNKEQWEALRPICEGCIREADNPPLLAHWFKLCMAYLARYASAEALSPNKPAHKLVIAFRQALSENLNKHLRPGAYADMLFVSTAHLNRVCRQETGKSASELIQAQLLEEVKRQLIYTQLPIKEIAYQLNFEDPAYFHRFFKLQTGLTPTAFREKLA